MTPRAKSYVSNCFYIHIGKLPVETQISDLPQLHVLESKPFIESPPSLPPKNASTTFQPTQGHDPFPPGVATSTLHVVAPILPPKPKISKPKGLS